MVEHSDFYGSLKLLVSWGVIHSRSWDISEGIISDNEFSH